MNLKGLIKALFRPFEGLNRHYQRAKARVIRTKSYRPWRGIGCWVYRARRWQNYMKRLRGEVVPV